MKFVMMSDTHYISRRMMCDPGNTEVLNDILVTEEALRQAAKEDCGTIIISGDLTDDGDLYSHEDFAKLLKEIKSSGKKVYVIFATHDFHHHRAYVRMKDDIPVKFRSRPWEMPYADPENIRYRDYVTDEFAGLDEEKCRPSLVPALSPEEIWTLYREFGPDEAYSVCETDFSYCVDLDENTRMLMLNDIFRNEEAMEDISASYTPTCFKWIKQMIAEAERDGKFICVCTHHPLIPAVPAHRLTASKRNLRTPYTVHILADMGINLAFTGHTHLNDVGFAKSDKGNTLCDIATASVRFFPPQYRKVDLDGKKGMVEYETVEIGKPAGADFGDAATYGYYRKKMYDEYYAQFCGKDTFSARKLRTLKIGDLYFLVKKASGLSPTEYGLLKDKLFFDYVMDLVLNMLSGETPYGPGTPEYKFGMGVAAVADSIIEAVPFRNIRKDSLGGYTVSQIVETLLFTDGPDNNKGYLDFTRMPAESGRKGQFSSRAGDIFTVLMLAAAVVISPALPVAFPAFLAAESVKCRKKRKREIKGPNYRY